MARYGLAHGDTGKSLNAATVTGPGDDFALPHFIIGAQLEKLTWEIVITGAPTAIQVDLQGSLDGVNWYQIDTYNTVANTLRFVVDKRVRFVRANLITLTGGTSPTVTANIFAG